MKNMKMNNLDLEEIPSEGCINLWSKKNDIKDAQLNFENTLKKSSLKDAISFWIKQSLDNYIYNPETIKNYRRYLEDLFSKGILPTKNQLGTPFCVDELYFNRKYILDALLHEKLLSDHEKRYRLNALIAFSKFLEIETLGKFKKFECPDNLLLSSTNRMLAPKSLTDSEYNLLINQIKKINERDGLIIDIVYYTARNLSNILLMKLDQIKLEDKTIIFKKNKDNIPVRINDKLNKDLMKYIETTKDFRRDYNYLFVTNNGKKIFRTRIAQILQKASEKINLGFIASTKMIQRSNIERHIKTGMTKEAIMKKFNLNNL